MTELQTILFDLLCEFDAICRKHNIVYYLSGGTNLGALRHGGFIPWDDDADVRMSRKEYERLNEVIDLELKDDRAFITHDRYKEYVCPIARYTDTTTTLLAKGRMADGTPHGIYLDVIILDPIPVDERDLKEWKTLHYVYCELMEYSRIAAARKRDWKYIDEKLYLEYEKKSSQIGRENVLKELESKLFCLEEKDAVNYCMRFGTTWLGITPIEWYGEPREILFEGKKLYAAKKAELCAFANYGPNWKNIPKVEDRMEHGVFRINNLESGNCEREYFKFIEPDEVIRIFKEYKSERINYYPVLHKTYFDRYKPLIKYINIKIDKALKNCDLNYIKENKEIIENLFDDYIELQLDPVIYSNEYFIPLKEEYCDILLEYLLEKNLVFEASRILEIWQKKNGLTECQIDMKDIIDKIVEIHILLEGKEYSEAEKLIEIYIGEFPDQLTLVKGYILINLNRPLKENRYGILKKYILEKIERYPEDGELLKYYGDFLSKQGDQDGASSVYEKAIELLNNGVMLLELANKNFNKAIIKIS